VHAKHATRLPGMGYEPPDGVSRTRHVWSWRTDRGERTVRRVYAVLDSYPLAGDCDSLVLSDGLTYPVRRVYARVFEWGLGIRKRPLGIGRHTTRKATDRPHVAEVRGTFARHVAECGECRTQTGKHNGLCVVGASF
jgi:hypothetical protein